MKIYKIRYSEEFVGHLESYLKDLEEKSPRAADKLRRNIRKHIIHLKKFPRQWGKVQSPVERLTKYRKIVLIFDYLLFYEFDEKNEIVNIVDIVYGRKNYYHLLS